MKPFASAASPLVASARGVRLAAVSAVDASVVTLSNLETDSAPSTLDLGASTVISLALSDDGARLAIGVSDPVGQRRAVQMWRTADRALEWDATSAWPHALAFSDGDVLSLAGRNAIYLLDCTTRAWLEPLYKKSSRIPSTLARVATHGALVAGGSLSTNGKPGVVQVFDRTAGKLVAELKLKSGACAFVTFSNDGSTLFAADSVAVHLFDTATWKSRAMIAIEGAPPIAVAPDGRSIVAARDTELSVRDAGGSVRSLQGSVSARVIAAIPPDGIVTFDRNGSGELWNVSELASAPSASVAAPHPLADPPRIARAALIAGRIVNETQERSHPGVVRAMYALADRWRERTGLPIVALEAPCTNSFDRGEAPSEEASQNPICVGLLVERVSADDGPRRIAPLATLRAEVERANESLRELWREMQDALDGLVRESFEGYGDDREMWRRANGALISDGVALHLVALPYDTKAYLAFGVARASAADGFEFVRGKTDRMEPQSLGVAGAKVLETNPDGAYIRTLDLTDAADGACRERVKALKGKQAYFVVASNVAG